MHPDYISLHSAPEQKVSTYFSVQETESWLKASQPTNTKEAYGTYSDQFRVYARAHNRDPYKASPNLISNFLRHLHVDNGLAATTIKGAYYAVDFFRFRSKSPHKHHLVKETLRVLKRLAKNLKKKLKQMIRPPVLKLILRNLDLNKVLHLRNAAMFVISYKAFLRSSECIGLKDSDMWMDFINVNGVLTDSYRNYPRRIKKGGDIPLSWELTKHTHGNVLSFFSKLT